MHALLHSHILPPGRCLGLWKDSFNYHLSAMRQVIERAFGLLTQRWGIFWRPLRVSMSKWGLVCTVAAKLHNFCIDEGMAILPSCACDVRQGDVWEVLGNSNDPHGLRPSGDRRRKFTSSFQALGILRPRHAFCNSKA